MARKYLVKTLQICYNIKALTVLPHNSERKFKVKSMLFPTEKYCVYVREYKRKRFGRVESVCQHYRSLPNR